MMSRPVGCCQLSRCALLVALLGLFDHLHSINDNASVANFWLVTAYAIKHLSYLFHLLTRVCSREVKFL